MLLAELVSVSDELRRTGSRTAKVALLAAALGQLDGEELRLAVSWLSGVLPQGRLGVGWAAVGVVEADAAPTPTLTLSEVDRRLTAIGHQSGSGSSGRRIEAVRELFTRATGGEQDFLRRLLLGELRQGAKEGLVIEAVAGATSVRPTQLRRALMLLGDLAETAVVAAEQGSDGLAAVGLSVGRPLRPMLASSAAGVEEALAADPNVTIEAKLDGMRVQVHRDRDEVLVVSRSLRDLTAELPGVAAAARALDVTSIVLDGEALAIRPDGRPAAFQESMSSAPEGAQAGMQPFFFDCLHLDGEDLLDLPLAERLARLDAVVPADRRVRRSDRPDLAAGERFTEEVLAAGHEGVVVKSLAAPYMAGRRGTAWIKVKPVHTLDLVVLAVEWGSGRRQGWLSNLHLGARVDDGFVMLGKTFKGLTDELLRWQTERLLELEVERRGHVVVVEPELVVEIAFDGVQDSRRYPGGVTLRFARVRRYRPDKTAAEADTLATVIGLRDAARR